jgi:hypothetical protein
MQLPKLLPAALLLLLLLHGRVEVVEAHPGGVADGRATCGTEYSTAGSAYEIPDIQQAWYLRRMATCDSPVFWTKFEVVSPDQPIYIAVISPEIARFQDELLFHGILYGPGITANADTGLSAVPVSSLPDDVQFMEQLGDAAYLTSPAKFDSCDFVDTNDVMKKYSDLRDGRCMEEFTLDQTFSDPLQREATAYSWWIYSFNHQAVEPGTYYLQTWLTTPDDPSSTAQGKYEITLGPWTWTGYASDSTLDLAQQQGTSCSCAVNALDYKEMYLERLGDLNPEFETAQLPGGSCAAVDDAAAPVSPCVTIPQQAYLSEGSALEWSGRFTLQAGRTYEWTFHAYYEGTTYTEKTSTSNYGYPDPGMYVYVVPITDMAVVVTNEQPDLILTAAVEEQGDSPVLIVSDGESVDIANTSQPQFISFTKPSIANSTTVLLQPPTSASDAAFTDFFIYTQHVPSEFMAHVLRDRESGEYIFPSTQTLYIDLPVDASSSSSSWSVAAVEEEEDAPPMQGEDDALSPSPLDNQVSVDDERDAADIEEMILAISDASGHHGPVFRLLTGLIAFSCMLAAVAF